MTLRVAINGFGRIGRNFMRCWLSRGAYTNIEVVGINVTSDPKTNAHLLKYDSVLGQLDGVDIQYTDDTFVINNKTIKCFSDRNPMNLPWKDWGVDLVIESTGVFNTDVGASKHLEVGAKKVILTAPGKGDGVGTYVVGVNADTYKHKDYDILSNASCTTNCLAPVVKVLDQTFGINKGLMTTIHSYTGDQRILDNSHRDLRRARAAATNIVPTSTGAAKAVAFGEALQPDFVNYSQQVIKNAKILASTLINRGIDIVSGGTDNHIVLLDLRSINMTGKIADLLVSEVNITANKNTVPFDPESPFVTSGLRLGTAALTTRGFNENAFAEVGEIIADRLLNPNDSLIENKCKERVLTLCNRFPLYEGKLEASIK